MRERREEASVSLTYHLTLYVPPNSSLTSIISFNVSLRSPNCSKARQNEHALINGSAVEEWRVGQRVKLIKGEFLSVGIKLTELRTFPWQ